VPRREPERELIAVSGVHRELRLRIGVEHLRAGPMAPASTRRCRRSPSRPPSARARSADTSVPSDFAPALRPAGVPARAQRDERVQRRVRVPRGAAACRLRCGEDRRGIRWGLAGV
jgi:hypothetical protein